MAASEYRRVWNDPEILGPEETREERVRSGFRDTLKRAARAIPFAEDVVAAWHCALDPETPRAVRWTLLAALAYFIAPADLVPDVMPIVGWTDDAGVLAAAIALVGRHISDEHREKAKETLKEG